MLGFATSPRPISSNVIRTREKRLKYGRLRIRKNLHNTVGKDSDTSEGDPGTLQQDATKDLQVGNEKNKEIFGTETDYVKIITTYLIIILNSSTLRFGSYKHQFLYSIGVYAFCPKYLLLHY